MQHRIYSPGKLLLTAEYLVLDGAKALAVPTKLGQELYWEEIQDSTYEIIWETYYQGILSLKLTYNYSTSTAIIYKENSSKEFIIKVLKYLIEHSRIRFQNKESYYLKSNVEFPANYGLGSSSTLMANLGEFTGLDPFKLNSNLLGGSGYDIAIAIKKKSVNLSDPKYNTNKDFRI